MADHSQAGPVPDDSPARPHYPRWNVLASHAVTAAVFVGVLCQAATPFRAHFPWLVYVQDDCFYYLKVAQNLATGHGSTFNGIAATNGYHPLWLLTLTLFRMAFPSGEFIQFIGVCVILATTATYLLARRLLQSTPVSPLVVNSLAGYVAAFSLPLFYTGMEVLLAIPLVLVFISMCERADLARHGMRHAFALGMAVSAMVLSRIDTILLAALVLGMFLTSRALRSQIHRSHLLGVALGLLPLLAYFLSNHILFDTWLPVSGMAKQLRLGHVPSAAPWRGLYGELRGHSVSVVPILLAYPLVPAIYGRLSKNQQVVFPVVLAWPILYVLMLSVVSDWRLWIWYFYPLRPALCVAFVLFCRWPPAARLARLAPFAAALALLTVAKLVTAKWPEGDMPDMVAVGEDVQRFALTHPGVYAMGDRAGSVGFLLHDPLVQTEGLMMDRAFLEEIRRALPLREALAPYHVRYYIATQEPPYHACFHAAEPSQAGPASPHLTQDFCGSPVAVFDQPDRRTAIYDLNNP